MQVYSFRKIQLPKQVHSILKITTYTCKIASLKPHLENKCSNRHLTMKSIVSVPLNQKLYYLSN